MILVPFFFILNVIGLISQYKRYQRLGIDAEQSSEPEEIAAFRSAQNKSILNMVMMSIGIISLIFLSVYFLSAPSI
jgi:hypothetical protein